MINTKPVLQRSFSTITLKKSTNQINGLARYAIDFLKTGNPSVQVINQVKRSHKDSTLCGILALAVKANAPSLFKNEAYQFMKKSAKGTSVRSKTNTGKAFGSNESIPVEKALVANVSAVSELDSNGVTVGFGRDNSIQYSYNDFYPAVIAAAHQNMSVSGDKAVKAMILLDEIKGRLMQARALSTPVDPVLYGAIATAITYGALMGATPDQIESAIGIITTHHVPYLPYQGSKFVDSIKSSAITAESAIISVKRAMIGFVGPADALRNPNTVFQGADANHKESPFDLTLAKEGAGFAIMDNHFRIGLYAPHTAGAIEAIIKILSSSTLLKKQNIKDIKSIVNINITTFKSALNTVEQNPTNRYSAVQSIPYIVSTLLRKNSELTDTEAQAPQGSDDLWKALMLLPSDYTAGAIKDTVTKEILKKITCEHGGSEYDQKAVDGVPTRIKITFADGEVVDSGLVLYPTGHAKNNECDMKGLLNHKLSVFGEMSVLPVDLPKIVERLDNLEELTNSEIQYLYGCQIKYAEKGIDMQF